MKNYLITGISKGLGLAIAKVLLEEWEDTVLYGVNRSNTESLENLKAAYPERLFFKPFDLMNIADLKGEIFQAFLNNKIKIDGFINNAAMAYPDLITNLKLEPLELMYRLNVFAPMMITKLVLRNMLLHKTQGSIVHVSSISAHTGYKGLAMYASTKGAMEAFSKNTAREWGSLGIRSNTVVAGFMETDMSEALSEEQKARVYKRTALKKATDKDSVAKAISFLLSDAASSITGQNIHVDAGTI